MSALQLDVINEAFGPTADLYEDVLGVQANASSDQIQRAYFERRNELFQLLAESEESPQQDATTANRRFSAERKMDGIVMSLRILGNGDSRAKYDEIRDTRIGKRPELDISGSTTIITYSMDTGDIPIKPKSPKSVLKKSSYNVAPSPSRDSITAGPSELTGPTDLVQDRSLISAFSFATIENPRTEDSKRKPSKRKARRVSPEENRTGLFTGRKKKTKNTDDSMVSTVVTESDAELESVVSEHSFRTMETTYSHYEKNRGCFEAIKDEVLGALDDTSQSFHQVFSVFTLREDEINAVSDRIEKARRQMIHTLSK